MEEENDEFEPLVHIVGWANIIGADVHDLFGGYPACDKYDYIIAKYITLASAISIPYFICHRVGFLSSLTGTMQIFITLVGLIAFICAEFHYQVYFKEWVLSVLEEAIRRSARVKKELTPEDIKQHDIEVKKRVDRKYRIARIMTYLLQSACVMEFISCYFPWIFTWADSLVG